MSNTIVVGMADLNVAKTGSALITYGLGSCVGVTLYDPIHRIAGMAHVMLPDSKTYRGVVNRAKFMDTAIEELLSRMASAGAPRSVLVAKIAGGAHMFGLSPESDVIKVGLRNCEMAQLILTKLSIPIKANQTGGKFGRTISIDADTGVLLIKTVGQGEQTV